MRKRKRIKTSKLFTFIICVCGALSIHFSTARSILLAAVFLKHFSFMILRLWFYDEWIYFCVWNDDLCHWFRMTSPPSSSPPAPLISFFISQRKIRKRGEQCMRDRKYRCWTLISRIRSNELIMRLFFYVHQYSCVPSRWYGERFIVCVCVCVALDLYASDE